MRRFRLSLTACQNTKPVIPRICYTWHVRHPTKLQPPHPCTSRHFLHTITPHNAYPTTTPPGCLTKGVGSSERLVHSVASTHPAHPTHPALVRQGHQLQQLQAHHDCYRLGVLTTQDLGERGLGRGRRTGGTSKCI